MFFTVAWQSYIFASGWPLFFHYCIPLPTTSRLLKENGSTGDGLNLKVWIAVDLNASFAIVGGMLLLVHSLADLLLPSPLSPRLDRLMRMSMAFYHKHPTLNNVLYAVVLEEEMSSLLNK